MRQGLRYTGRGRWSPPPRPVVALTTAQAWLATVAEMISSGIEPILSLEPLQVAALGMLGMLATLQHANLGDRTLQRAAHARLLAALAIASRSVHEEGGAVDVVMGIVGASRFYFHMVNSKMIIPLPPLPPSFLPSFCDL